MYTYAEPSQTLEKRFVPNPQGQLVNAGIPAINGVTEPLQVTL